MEKHKYESGLTPQEIEANNLIFRMIEQPQNHYLWVTLRSITISHLRPKDQILSEKVLFRLFKLHHRTGCERDHFKTT